MSLITPSYFRGEIKIAQLTQPTVLQAVQEAIDRYESEYLKKILGYQLYLDFIAGLLGSPIQQKWLDLLNGVDFTSSLTYRLTQWQGFVNVSSFTPYVPTKPESVFTVTTQANTNTFTLPELAGADFWIERRFFGYMIDGVDYTLSNNKQTVTLAVPGDVLAPGEVFIIHYGKRAGIGGVVQNPTSPIAYYVYFMYARENATQTMGVNENAPETENGSSVYPIVKMSNAWNKMVEQNKILLDFLNVNSEVYGFQRMQTNRHLYYNTNVLNI